MPGIVHHLSGPNVYALGAPNRQLQFRCPRSAPRPSHSKAGISAGILRQLSRQEPLRSLCMKAFIVTQLLAYKLDSLVRVSRRVSGNKGNRCHKKPFIRGRGPGRRKHQTPGAALRQNTPRNEPNTKPVHKFPRNKCRCRKRFFIRGRVQPRYPQRLRPTSNQSPRRDQKRRPSSTRVTEGQSQPAVTAIREKTGDDTCSPSEFQDRKARKPRRTPKPIQFPKTRARQAIVPESTQTPRPDSSCLPLDGFTHS